MTTNWHLAAYRRITKGLMAHAFFWLAFALIGAWGLDYIWRSSIHLDGKRYFLLFDDAMISMRYASHLADGQGLVFNATERIEGFTNPLWTLLMAVAIKVSGQFIAPLIIQLFGLLLLLTTVASSYAAIIQLSNDYRIRALSVVIIGGCYPLAYWSLGGMEVSALAALTAVATFFSLKGQVNARPILWASISIAYLLRPDGFLVLLPLLLLHEHVANPALPRCCQLRNHFWGGTAFAVVIGTTLLLRYAYYGEWVPNTYVLKVEGYGLGLRVSNGLSYLREYFSDTLPLWLLAGYGAVFHSHRKLLRMLMCMPTVAVIYQIYVGGDAFDNWRQMVPATVVLVLVSAAGLDVFLLRHAPNRLARLAIITAITTIGFLNINKRSLDEIFFEKPYTYFRQGEHVKTALALKTFAPSARIMVFWAGTLPYYFGGYAIDALGKADAVVARLPINRKVIWAGMEGVPGHAKHDLTFSAQDRNADFIQYTEWYGDHVSSDVLSDFASVEINGQKLCVRKAIIQTLRSNGPITERCPAQ